MSSHIGQIPEGTFCSELSDAQFSAIQLSVQLGKVFQETLPGIEDDYRTGLSLADIVTKYGLVEEYGYSVKTLQMGISKALGGYDGNLEIVPDEPYPGLIKTDEMKAIGEQHNAESARVMGKLLLKEGRGIFGMTDEERAEAGRKSGRKAVELGLGIHAQTAEERRKYLKLALEAQGKTPFSDEEITCIKELADDPDFQRKSRINAKKIAEEINHRFHAGASIRNPRAIVKVFSSRIKHKAG